MPGIIGILAWVASAILAILAVLKLAGVLSASWWVVASPVLGVMAVGLIIVIMAGLLLLGGWFVGMWLQWKEARELERQHRESREKVREGSAKVRKPTGPVNKAKSVEAVFTDVAEDNAP